MDKEWSKIYSAPEDPKWAFRTVEGIATDTGLDPECVERLLDQHRSEIRQHMSRDRRIIYTLKSRPKKMREIIADLQVYASKSL